MPSGQAKCNGTVREANQCDEAPMRKASAVRAPKPSPVGTLLATSTRTRTGWFLVGAGGRRAPVVPPSAPGRRPVDDVTTRAYSSDNTTDPSVAFSMRLPSIP